MIISKQTIDVLKNFAYYNNGLSVAKGNTLRTVHPQQTVLVEYTSEENFEQAFAVYDLSTLLSVLSVSGDSPDIEFGQTEMTINGLNGKIKTKYRYCDVSNITVPPAGNLQLDKPEIEFILEQSIFEKAINFASILSLPNLNFKSDGKDIYIIVNDLKNDGSNSNSIHVCKLPKGNDEFNVSFKTSHFKFIPGDYSVKISKKGLAKFTHQKMNLNYWVAIESNGSSYTTKDKK